MKYIRPLQKISSKDKNEEWGKLNVNYWSSQTDNYFSAEWKRMKENYLLNNNVIDQERFKNICDPLGLDSGIEMEYVQPFNKITNKINVLIGEEYKRPINFTVKQNNPEVSNKIDRDKKLEYRKYINYLLNKEKLEVQSKHKQVPKEELERLQQQEAETLNFEQISEKYKNYKTDKEFTLQMFLKLFLKDSQFKDKSNEGMYHALIAGLEAVHVFLQKDKLSIEVVNPLGLFYHKDPEEQFIQNGDAVGYKKQMTVGSIIDRFGDQLKEDDLKELSNYSGVFGMYGAKRASKDGFAWGHWENRQNFNQNSNQILHSGSYGQSSMNNDYLNVTTVYWRSWKKVGVLKTVNEYGDSETVFVDEKFSVPKYASVSNEQNKFYEKKKYYSWDNNKLCWEWLPQIYEGTKIEDKVFLNIRPLPWQKIYLNNPYYAPLPIFGAPYNNRNAPIVSIFDRGKYWQYLFFAVMHKWIKLIMQDKGIMHSLNLSLLDKELPVDVALKYAMEIGVLPFNPTNTMDALGSQGNTQKIIESHNLSNPNLERYTNILNYVDEQIGDAMGVTKQREGQNSAYTTATDNRQAIIQSSHITEPEFKLHSNIWFKVLEYCTKTLPYITDSEKIRSVLSDGEIAILDLDQLTPFDDFDLLVEDSQKTFQNLEVLKGNAQAIFQNNENALDYITTILEAESMPELKKSLNYIKEEIRLDQERMQQYQKELQEQQSKAARDLVEDQQAHEIEMEKIKGNFKLEEAKIDVFKFQQELDMNNDGIPDPLQVATLEHKIAMDLEDKSLKREELALKDKKIELDAKKVANKK